MIKSLLRTKKVIYFIFSLLIIPHLFIISGQRKLSTHMKTWATNGGVAMWRMVFGKDFWALMKKNSWEFSRFIQTDGISLHVLVLKTKKTNAHLSYKSFVKNGNRISLLDLTTKRKVGAGLKGGGCGFHGMALLFLIIMYLLLIIDHNRYD